MPDKNAIRPFHVNVPDAELTELRRRVAAARLPERETVTDFSQGVPRLRTVSPTVAGFAGPKPRRVPLALG
jgi:epoxide hydrolase-like protein